MCGIAGVSLNPDDKKLDVAAVSASLLNGIAYRGPDAAGAAWYDHLDDTVKLTKLPINPREFVKVRKDSFPESTPVMVLHTRMGTKGSKNDRNNNHPIHFDNIVGTHNGVIWNDGALFKALGKTRIAQVDSEAIMALLSDGADPSKVLGKINGDAALAWIDTDDPEELHLAHVSGRSLYVAQTPEGSLVYASTEAVVDAALAECGLVKEFGMDVPEETYIKVRFGRITDFIKIEGVVIDRGWSDKYAYTSGVTKGTKAAPKKAPAKAISNNSKTVVGHKPLPKTAGTLVKSEPDKLIISPEQSIKKLMASRSNEQLVLMAKNGSERAKEELESRSLHPATVSAK